MFEKIIRALGFLNPIPKWTCTTAHGFFKALPHTLLQFLNQLSLERETEIASD